MVHTSTGMEAARDRWSDADILVRMHDVSMMDGNLYSVVGKVHPWVVCTARLEDRTKSNPCAGRLGGYNPSQQRCPGCWHIQFTRDYNPARESDTG